MARLFVSDVHLDAGAPESIEQFLSFLEVHARPAEALYILGDLFESWIGDDDADPGKARVAAALRGLTATGVAAFIMHGNRDFLLGSDFCQRTGCALLVDPTLVELDGERVLLTHGDALCTDDRAYQRLRSSVRTPAWQQRFLGLPLPTREHLAQQARADSQVHTARVVREIMDVNASAVEKSFRALAVRRIIHGHTHRPAIHHILIDGESAQRIVLGAWYEQGSYLWYERGGFELRELPR
ncbi:MAG TPA: UDP-2,3-diacylglucosamine diphosphatase [Steroidobacteraceae bacterium]|jgi:UDP-2,3-diacylglucosamine hydrolase|nr:UDP-2,3-diacylglucosamine diphosphatase [Steroidobacteraceae bacterium]